MFQFPWSEYISNTKLDIAGCLSPVALCSCPHVYPAKQLKQNIFPIVTLFSGSSLGCNTMKYQYAVSG
jgi:hypothetical protein